MYASASGIRDGSEPARRLSGKIAQMHPLIEGLPGGAEWIVLLVVAMLLFGGQRLAGIGKGAGRAVREFKEETQTLKTSDAAGVPATTAAARPAAPVASGTASEQGTSSPAE